MSSADGSSGRLGSTPRTSNATVSLKLLQAATALLRCRNLLVEKRNKEAREELSLLAAALVDLDGQPMNEEQARELRMLQEEAARLETKTQLLTAGRNPPR